MTIRTTDTDLLWLPLEWLVELLQSLGYQIQPGERVVVVLVIGADRAEFIERIVH